MRLFIFKATFRLMMIFIVLPAVVSGCIYHLNQKGFFNIHRLQIDLAEGEISNDFLDPQVEKLRSDLSFYEGKSLWRVSLKEADKYLKSNSWIKSYHVSKNWPDGLMIKIEPQSPKLLLLGKQGKLFPVISDGQILDSVEPYKAPDLAVLSGDNFVEKPDLRRKAVEVLEQVPKEGSFSRSKISEVHYSVKEGFWMNLIKSGLKVKMGEESIGIKSARVSQVIDYLDNKEIKARVIDANLSKKVVVRLRKDP